MLTTPSASGSSGSASRIWSAHLVIPTIAALAVLYLTLRYGAFPGPGEVSFLDLIALEDPLAHEALPVSCFAAPAGDTLPLG